MAVSEGPAGRLRALLDLGDEWHDAGTLSNQALEAMDEHLSRIHPAASAETGAGRSTILFSWHSQAHTTYALDWGRSVSRVMESSLTVPSRVRWVDGPTQRTLAQEAAAEPLDAVLLDGPHGFPFPQLEYFHLYPRLRPGALIVVDDIHIRSIGDLFRFMRADAMRELVATVDKTAFFLRTDSSTIDPFSDSWWLQAYNQPGRLGRLLRAAAPTPLRDAARAFRYRIRRR